MSRLVFIFFGSVTAVTTLAQTCTSIEKQLVSLKGEDENFKDFEGIVKVFNELDSYLIESSIESCFNDLLSSNCPCLRDLPASLNTVYKVKTDILYSLKFHKEIQGNLANNHDLSKLEREVSELLSSNRHYFLDGNHGMTESHLLSFFQKDLLHRHTLKTSRLPQSRDDLINDDYLDWPVKFTDFSWPMDEFVVKSLYLRMAASMYRFVDIKNIIRSHFTIKERRSERIVMGDITCENIRKSLSKVDQQIRQSDIYYNKFRKSSGAVTDYYMDIILEALKFWRKSKDNNMAVIYNFFSIPEVKYIAYHGLVSLNKRLHEEIAAGERFASLRDDAEDIRLALNFIHLINDGKTISDCLEHYKLGVTIKKYSAQSNSSISRLLNSFENNSLLVDLDIVGDESFISDLKSSIYEVLISILEKFENYTLPLKIPNKRKGKKIIQRL